MADSHLHTLQLKNWLERMQQGDQTAREEMLRGISFRMEKMARKMLNGFHRLRTMVETEDVLSSSLMRLLRSLEHIKPESMRSFYGLAAQQIRRELIDLARHYYGPHGYGSYHQAFPQPDNLQGKTIDSTEIAEDEEELDRWCRFHKAVEDLPVELREVVSLQFYHGWTQKQIAELFQCSEKTIQRRWREALLALNQTLNCAFPEEKGSLME